MCVRVRVRVVADGLACCLFGLWGCGTQHLAQCHLPTHTLKVKMDREDAPPRAVPDFLYTGNKRA